MICYSCRKELQPPKYWHLFVACPNVHKPGLTWQLCTSCMEDLITFAQRYWRTAKLIPEGGNAESAKGE